MGGDVAGGEPLFFSRKSFVDDLFILKSTKKMLTKTGVAVG